ncbi:MAG: exodeoxyribonuclease VII small subunit [Bacteroidetes bacterium]|nr:exodeoxyribonuclease VII small subunit [Bacteroidota bacterium]
MAKKEKFSYQNAITEIESILEKMENEELDVDVLSFQVKRVSHLIKLCREKLQKTEQEVEKILDEMDKEEE